MVGVGSLREGRVYVVQSDIHAQDNQEVEMAKQRKENRLRHQNTLIKSKHPCTTSFNPPYYRQLMEHFKEETRGEELVHNGHSQLTS